MRLGAGRLTGPWVLGRVSGACLSIRSPSWGRARRGLSAAARAAVRGLSHIVLERAPQPSNTIFKFQKGKHVMAQPAHTPLRSEIPFEDGRREDVLAAWQARAEEAGVNFRFDAEVTGITGSRGDFTISLKDGTEVRAETVVLAVGLQGNLNTLRVPGAELPHVGIPARRSRRVRTRAHRCDRRR